MGVLTRSDGHGLGDDPAFMYHFIRWTLDPTHDVAWASYFDSGTCALIDSPQSLAVYRAFAIG